LKFKVEQAKRFLAKGHKVKVTVQFKQAFHLKDQCLAQLEPIAELIGAETGEAMAQPRQQYGGVYVYFSPANAD
jgi:translation initiation factor IF-3